MAKNGFSMSNRVAVEKITGDKTLTADDCGKVFIVDSRTQGSAVDIILPNRGLAADGWNATFIMESGSGTGDGPTPAQNVVLTGSAGDSTGEPFILIASFADQDKSGQGGRSAAEITVPGSTLANGDCLKVTMGEGDVLGKIWYVQAMTSGALQ